MMKTLIANSTMRFLLILLCGSLAVFSYQSGVVSEDSQIVDLRKNVSQKPEHAIDRVLVRMRDRSLSQSKASGGSRGTISQKQVLAAAENSMKSTGLSLGKFANGESVRALDSEGNMISVAIDNSVETVETAIARLKQNADVEFVQPDYVYRRLATPNDTEYWRLWGLKNSGQTIPAQHSLHNRYSVFTGTTGRDMSMETAWDKVTDCSTVVVAVIDTGINLQHSDLVDNLWDDGMGNHGYDFVNADTDPNDDEGHGTHVAGTIGARGNNGSGTTGVCWRVQLMAVKVLDADGVGFTSDIVLGVNYATTRGADIINMSLGGGSFDLTFSDAVKNASDANILVVVAAGNSGTNASLTYPCAFTIDNMICVGAVDQNFNIASFSNYSTSLVHIGAPGTNIASSTLGPIAESSVSLQSGWTATGDWLQTPSFPYYLQAPATYDGSSVRYTRNLKSAIYRNFDFRANARTYGSVSFAASVSADDTFRIHGSPTNGVNPSTAGDTDVYSSYTGTTANTTRVFEFENCRNSYCSAGFELNSGDEANQLYGVRVLTFSLIEFQAGTTGYDTYNGTSMAAPHVAGLGALLKAYSPTMSAREMREVILKSGTRFSGLQLYFQQGSVVNAAQALRYIPKPNAPGVTVN